MLSGYRLDRARKPGKPSTRRQGTTYAIRYAGSTAILGTQRVIAGLRNSPDAHYCATGTLARNGRTQRSAWHPEPAVKDRDRADALEHVSAGKAPAVGPARAD